ncbi:hypothetical protein [Pseudomonas sp. BN102]|uniref:hypothetical protein n=1 Tax=Pseudomonas sp. BN102 TaxID=2567886 RepID=UPI0024537F42|nr:hypothetical protein [Pseudomonas sp. BN102]MDH4607313.1 hypothetical protein [Pseudomonas sp. BN102]
MSVQVFKYFRAQYAATIFSLALLLGYGGGALFAYFSTDNGYFVDLAFLALVSSVTVFVFSKVSLIRERIIGPKIILGVGLLFLAVFGLFACFAAMVLGTAEGIPLLAWFAGADPETLVVLREKFLKAREGWQAIFPYINGLFTGALIPYCLAYFFLEKFKWRWLAFFAFLAYCLVFIEKVFFLKAMIPLLYVAFCVRSGSLSTFVFVASLCVSIVIFLGVVSGFGSGIEESSGDFFSGQYRAVGTLNYLAWRAIAVPIFTAADALAYFSEGLHSNLLMGATSSLLSAIFGLERVEFEHLVFEYQWGQTETGTGSANSVYFVDAYVNFGMMGVVLFSAIIGVIFRMIANSTDEALHAIWPLFAFGLYVSGLVGNLASNGFILIFLFCAIAQVRHYKTRRRDISGGMHAPALLPESR